MIGKLIDLCARHRGLVLFFYLVAAIGAVQALRDVKLDAIPDLSDPQVIVFTEWRGRSPTVVEDQVTVLTPSNPSSTILFKTFKGSKSLHNSGKR